MKPLWNSLPFRLFRLLCFLVLVALWSFNYLVHIAPYLSKILDVDDAQIERVALLALPLYAALWLLSKLAPHLSTKATMRRRESVTFWLLVLWLVGLYFPVLESLCAASLPVAWQRTFMGHVIAVTGLPVPVRSWPYVVNTGALLALALPLGAAAWAVTLVVYRTLLPWTPRLD